MNPWNGCDVALDHLSTTDPAGYFHLQWEEHFRRQQSGSFTDLLLLAGGLLVPVHQAVLLPLSHVLSQVVSLPCCCQSLPTVSLPGVDPASVLSMVHLVYTGRCTVSSGLEYFKLMNLLENLGIYIDQTLVGLDDAQLDQPLNLCVYNTKTESEDAEDADFVCGNVATDEVEVETDNEKSMSTIFEYDGNNGYCHKKFRASVLASPSSENHRTSVDASLEPEIKLEYFPEENPEKEIMNQNKKANQRMGFLTSKEKSKGIMDAFDLMECFHGNGMPQENLRHNVTIENSCTSDKASERGDSIEKPQEEFICACERCGMQFLSDKLVSYILHQKDCPKVEAGANTEAADVNFSNAEAKTSMMSEVLECPHCDEICSSMVNYVAHLDNCQKNDHVWDVNSNKQLEIANNISIDEEELADSPKADENHGILSKENTRRISSKSCQLCSDVFLPPYHLKMHYTERHFFRELSERVPSGNLNCNICERKFSCRKALILHIGATHEIVLDLLAKKLEEDAENCNKIRIYGDKSDSFDELIIDVDNDSPIMSQELHETKNCRLKCDICEMSFNTNYLLQAHYSTRHYNVQLDAEFAGDYESRGGACPLCNKATKSLSQFIQHVGAFHNEVSKYRGTPQLKPNSSRCYTCPLTPCQLQFPQKSHMVRHLSTSHYLNELNTLAMSFWTSHKTCPKCQKLFSDFVKFRNHLSVTHNMIEKFYSKSVKEYLASLPTKKRKSFENEDLKGSHNSIIKSEVESQVFEYFCHRCDKRFPNLTYLLNHLTLVHYRQKLTSKFAKAMKTNICNICKVNIELADSNKMLRHIGVTHRRVLSCLPKDVSEKLNEKTSERAKMCFDERPDNKKKSKAITFNESLVKTEDNNMQSWSNANFRDTQTANDDLPSLKQDERLRPKVLLKGEDRLCRICDNESRTLSALLLHLTTTHFRADLRKEFLVYGEKFPKQCPFCQKKMLTSQSFLSHVGTTHRKVIDYASWIEESPEGELWFSNKKGVSSYRKAEEAKRIHSMANQISHISGDHHSMKTSSSKSKDEARDLNQNKPRHAVEALKPFYGEHFFTGPSLKQTNSVNSVKDSMSKQIQPEN